jgi:hypothetical protein
MPYTKEFLQNLRDEVVRNKDLQIIERATKEIEEEVLQAAKIGKEFYEWRTNNVIPRIQNVIYNKLLTIFIDCRVTKTEFGIYISWV